MTLFKNYFLLLGFMLFSFNLQADTKNDEIAYLLNFVAQTQCTYDRNGKEYSGSEARVHIQKKYDYYEDDIKTAEDFIAYSATKSMISGEKYQVFCEGKVKQYSADWLLQALTLYRNKKSQ